MNISCGIVGLPNVGKSTLFNALLKKQVAFVANYPFATIEPNVGVVPVPDERLEVLADIVAGYASTSEESSVALRSTLPPRLSSKRTPSSVPSEVSRKRPPIVPATVKFVDIAGLVKGASEGAGLGNKFLSHIREVSVIAHVVRAFEDLNVIKEGVVDPKSDYQTIQTELILSDLESISKRKSQKSNPQLKSQNYLIDKIYDALNKGIPVRDLEFSKEEREIMDQLFLLSAKPEIMVLNVSEEKYSRENIEPILNQYTSILGVDRERVVIISAKIEAELAELKKEEQKEYLSNLGLKESGLERLIKKAYETLGLISFLTAGEKEVRAWTIQGGTKAVDAAGVIHTDFVQHFIKAEVVTYNDFIQNNGWKGSRENGKARMEGRDYIVKDGDVIEFKIGK